MGPEGGDKEVNYCRGFARRIITNRSYTGKFLKNLINNKMKKIFEHNLEIYGI